jgi:hypothetical protein
MITVEQTVAWLGMRVTDATGNAVGKLEGIYVDRTDGAPRWLLVATGRFGSRSVLAPVGGAAAGNGILMLDAARGQVLSSPRCTLAHAPLAAIDDRALARHYRLFTRLREISQAHDHVTTASPVTDVRAIAAVRDRRFAPAA